VGLTGPMGAGKSTVGRALAHRGAVVIDTDQVARDVVAPGSIGYDAVVAHFGAGVTATPDGSLDRRELASIVFSDPVQLTALESITHPLVRAEVARRTTALAGQEVDVVVVELPLLDERRRAEYGLDLVVLVDALADTVMARMAARGLSPAQVRARQEVQPTAAQRKALADFVVNNDGGHDQLTRSVDEVWAWLQGLAAQQKD
jgi:dephospho-CoA kinase